ncbi:hypothetical protein PAHAL_6G169800 [Panicum hallii]|uniref:Uncharacterized protein n=1 Tax=Panicum hallii TaxID=206008 RepID=A0A2T8IGI8_9POAL|nr:hypothetical protein PAHAL_6G169800 [Panicum hallii]
MVEHITSTHDYQIFLMLVLHFSFIWIIGVRESLLELNFALKRNLDLHMPSYTV